MNEIHAKISEVVNCKSMLKDLSNKRNLIKILFSLSFIYALLIAFLFIGKLVSQISIIIAIVFLAFSVITLSLKWINIKKREHLLKNIDEEKIKAEILEYFEGKSDVDLYNQTKAIISANDIKDNSTNQLVQLIIQKNNELLQIPFIYNIENLNQATVKQKNAGVNSVIREAEKEIDRQSRIMKKKNAVELSYHLMK